MLLSRFQHSDSTERRPVRKRYVGMAEYAGYVLRNQCAFGFESCMFWRCATLSIVAGLCTAIFSAEEQVRKQG